MNTEKKSSDPTLIQLIFRFNSLFFQGKKGYTGIFFPPKDDCYILELEG